jgi:hypothetical protein
MFRYGSTEYATLNMTIDSAQLEFSPGKVFFDAQ